ncbi:hypothetical protein [Nakamurella sp. PAMC28650]|uniref:hypothetical protein n=1 Tax=Nakamurella sp. PAMC28650 TaxID=2762325 RepID=UPI00164DC2B3|nr:hypothetical protein [Nakamurella sp. PAMC28650]QNK80481.1 hypothetical protein H7F38_20245 [Nakamurella sp. PAMC28650]
MNTDTDLHAELDALADLAPSDVDVRRASAGRIDLRVRRRRTSSLVAAAAAVVLFAGGAGIAGSLISNRTAGPAAPTPTISAAGTERPGAWAGSAAAQHAVVRGYLEAVEARDCATADRYFVGGQAQLGNGDLCHAGSLRLLGYQTVGVPATPSPEEAVVAVRITTSGSSDGTIPSGETTWFLDLHRQPDGYWLIAGGGSGP